MPIQIIPKEAAKLPLWQNILFYISIGVVLSILAAYGVLYHFTKKANEDANKIEEAIKQAKTDPLSDLENYLKSFRDRVNDFASLIDNHKFTSNFFGNFISKIGILEKDTHPKVYFSEMTLNAAAATATLSGSTESFKIVAQQVALFQNDKPMVQNVKLTKADVNSKEGKIDFSLDITLDPALLKSFCGDEKVSGAEECDGEKGVPENFICTSDCTLESSNK